MFTLSTTPEPHRARTRALLEAHPEARRLIGRNPWSFAIVAGLVAVQLALMVAARDLSWGQTLLLAWTLGAVISHALFVMIHECAHNLIFVASWGNSAVGLLANVPCVVPSAASFQRYHLLHHAHQGVHGLDADLPSEWEVRLVGRSPSRKALWLLLFALVTALRPLRLRSVPFLSGWVLANIAVQIAVNVLVVACWGWHAFAYLAASLLFSVGLHPLGARWIQEHYLMPGSDQETTSYYGPANRLAFNVGYHNEHHDLPSIPWNRLPRLRAMAPELYVGLPSHTSWTRVLVLFLLDPRMSLHSRVVRCVE